MTRKPSGRTPSVAALRGLMPLACGATLFACAPERPTEYRGRGLEIAHLSPNETVGIYRATLAAGFSLDDPALVLLLDPALLPRGEGLAGGDSMPSAVASALQRQRFVKGTCTIPAERTRTPLVCRAHRPGYVVRLSAPFALGERRDSVQVHLVVDQYTIPRGPAAERLRFERAYHLARRGSGWRAVGEARLPQP